MPSRTCKYQLYVSSNTDCEFSSVGRLTDTVYATILSRSQSVKLQYVHRWCHSCLKLILRLSINVHSKQFIPKPHQIVICVDQAMIPIPPICTHVIVGCSIFQYCIKVSARNHILNDQFIHVAGSPLARSNRKPCLLLRQRICQKILHQSQSVILEGFRENGLLCHGESFRDDKHTIGSNGPSR